METENKPANWISAYWQRNRMVFKGLLIAFLVLLLLIPTAFIHDLIRERQGRQQEAINEISSKWATQQTLAGPVIGIPFLENVKDERGVIRQVKEIAYFLPEDLQFKGDLQPEQRSRGIYKVIVYTGKVSVDGNFSKLDIASLGIDSSTVLWKEAFVLFSVDDLRGIKDEVKLNINGTSYELIPGKVPGESFGNTLLSKIDLSDPSITRKFNMSIHFRGSKSLHFLPFGKRTNVSITSPWSDPSFTGNYLPDNRVVNNQGFNAQWKVLYMNRNFPQQWKGQMKELNESAFGVDLLVPVDSYLKSERTVKYAILCIVLTFTAFLMIELIYTKSIHAFQYILVGFALCLFYTLLISISEYLNFNTAYLIAAIATITMIYLYIRSVFNSNRIASFIGLTLVFMYGFIYVLIQSQDYALLMGSIGLFLTLGLVMYFSRKAKMG